jgi:hypothetical protein
MKLHIICKYAGLISGAIGALYIISGIIGFFTGEFLNVRNFSWFFWAANTFVMFGIFCMVVYIAFKDREKETGD